MDGAEHAPSRPITRHVVVAEDDDNMAMMLEHRLRRAGYQPTVVRDGAAAIDAITRIRPHVALLDLGMPKVDGATVVRTIRADGSLAAVRLVVLSGRDDAVEAADLLRAGADDYLVKPVDAHGLLVALDPDGADDRAGAPRRPAPPEGATIDLSNLAQWLAGDERLLAQQVGRIDAAIADQLLAVEAAHESGLADAVVTTAHQLLGTLANVRAEGAVGVARAIEDAARDGSLHPLDELRAVVAEVRASLRDWARRSGERPSTGASPS